MNNDTWLKFRCRYYTDGREYSFCLRSPSLDYSVLRQPVWGTPNAVYEWCRERARWTGWRTCERTDVRKKEMYVMRKRGWLSKAGVKSHNPERVKKARWNTEPKIERERTWEERTGIAQRECAGGTHCQGHSRRTRVL